MSQPQTDRSDQNGAPPQSERPTRRIRPLTDRIFTRRLKDEDDPAQARRTVASIMLQLLLLLLVLLLIAAATGRTTIISFPGIGPLQRVLQPQLGVNAARPQLAAGDEGDLTAGNISIPAVNSLNAPPPAIGPRFQNHYNTYGGERIFGQPISEPLLVNGRTIQWFERARLEEWPEFAGTRYEIQGGRVGAEFTDGLIFVERVFFVSQPDARYFPETGHGVHGPFLRFWEQHGGVDIFGYPLSEELQERLPDGQIRTVQYFERARLEHYPEHAGTPLEVQIGLLGRGLYLRESRPDIVSPPGPHAPTR